MDDKNWFLPCYKDYAKKVVEFNVLADNGVVNNSPEKIELQKKLIQEELDEVVEAYSTRNKKEFVKELCDLFVVTSYMIYLTKPDEFNDPSCFVCDNRFGAPPLYSAIGLMSDMCYIEDWRSLIKAVIGMLNVIEVDEKKALGLVNDNNFSKFMWYNPGYDETYDEMARAIETSSEGRYKNIMWYKVDNWVIFKDDNGKIMKPIGYRPLNLSKLM